MKRKIISKSVLNLFVAVSMLISLAIGFALPAAAQIPDCENPDCLNPEIYVCAGTTFNDQLLIDNGVGCAPPPGTGYDDGEGFTYDIVVDYNFIQNPSPSGTIGANLEGTAPGPGLYYYHVFCDKFRHFGGTPPDDACSCASVGYIYVYGCAPNAEDFTVCLGNTLTEQDVIDLGNVSCTGEGCTLESVDFSAVDMETADVYPYTVTCYSQICGEQSVTAYITVQDCGDECICEAPDLTVCQGEELTDQMFLDAGATCPNEGCEMALDYSAVDTDVPGVYTYTLNCGNSVCWGAVTVVPACVAYAPDITICQYDDVAYALECAKAGCSESCEECIDYSSVNNCIPGVYTYTVTCLDACGGECGDDTAEGTITVLPCVDVEIIEAAGYEKYVEGYNPCGEDGGQTTADWEAGCEPGSERMIVPVSSDFAIKAVIENCSGCILYAVTPYIIIEGPAVLIDGMPNHWNLGNMEGGEDADCTEVVWTLHCTGPGTVKVTVMVNDCAKDVVCFDQREPAELTVTCDSPCESGINCYEGQSLQEYEVTATIKNLGDTVIEDAQVVLTASPGGLVEIDGPTKLLGDMNPDDSIDVTWDVEVASTSAEGDVTFTVTASGTDECGDIPLEVVCETTTAQRAVLVDVEAEAIDDCEGENEGDCITVSVGQLFDIETTIINTLNIPNPAVITLFLPEGSAIVTPNPIVNAHSDDWATEDITLVPDLSVPGQATVTINSPNLCACCEVELTWHLVCTESAGGSCETKDCAPYHVEVFCCDTLYSSLPCNPASVCQEDPAELSAYLVGPFVEDCDCEDLIKVDAVAVGQEYDVMVTVTNSGEADATGVEVDIEIEGDTSCTGEYTLDFGTICGGETKSLWLSEAIQCELECLGEEVPVIIQITEISGEDENTCLEVEGPITDLCGLEIPQCDIDVEIINPVSSTEIDQYEVFAVKARIDNCGECSFDDVSVNLMWSSGGDTYQLAGSGGVELVEGSVNPVIIDHIEAPCEDCVEECRFEEVTWMVRCTCPGDVFFDVCVESATPHLQIKTEEPTTIHQIERDLALVCVDILSPDKGSKYATSEEFAITAEITNLECCAPIKIEKANINVGGIPWNETTLEVVGETMPPLPWVINPGETKIVTWTAHCTGSGLTWFNVCLEGISDEYETVLAYSEPVSVWQYPAAHLEVTIDDYPTEPIVTGTTFDMTFTVTNTGEADATEVYANLCVTPEGSVRIAGPSEDGYSIYIGTIPGHGSEANSVTKTVTLRCKEPCDSTIKITVDGNDEYGWHMKQECASTGSFVIEGGFESVEGLTFGLPIDLGTVNNKGWFYGIFYGDANGLFGPFNAVSPVSWAMLGGGPDFTGEVQLMGAVLPDVSLLTAEQLSYFMCHDGNCICNADCNFQCLCELIKGRDVMVFIGHIESDTPYDLLPDNTNFCVGGGLLQIINGQLSGSYLKFSQDVGPWVKSLLGGEYCSNMAATAGIPIQAGFIEPDEVTVKQLPAMTDLSICKEACTCCYTVGETACFVITVTNNGPLGAPSVLVQDVLPAGLSFNAYTASQGWYDETSGFWSVGDLPYPGYATLNITATVSAAGQICNQAVIVAMDGHDPVTENNVAEACITAEPAEELTLTLDEDYNLISLPLIPTGDFADPELALDGVTFDLIAMMAGSSETSITWGLYNPPAVPSGSFIWEDGYGYWMIDTAPGQTLTIGGVELVSGMSLPPSYEVAAGWNLIGFKSTAAKLPQDYLAGIEGKYVMIYGYDNGAFYAVGSPGHAMLQPGFGYWLAVKVGEYGIIFP